MKNQFTIIAIILATSVITGCNNQQEETVPTDNILQLSSQIKAPTRATDAGFTTGDKIGLYAVAWTSDVPSAPGTLTPTGNYSDNIMFSSDGAGGLTSMTDIHYPDGTTQLDLYAYYPWNSEGQASPSGIKINIETDQSVADAYTRSDVMVATTTGISRQKTAVPLAFDHILSKVTIELVNGEGYSSLSDLLPAQVKILNVITDAAFGLVNSPAILIGEARNDITPAGTFALATGKLTGLSGIVIPQAIGANTPLLTITIGSNSFHYTPAEDIFFEPNKVTNFLITVNKTGLNVTASINPWGEPSQQEGETVQGTLNTLTFTGRTNLSKVTLTLGNPTDEKVLADLFIHKGVCTFVAPIGYTTLKKGEFTTVDAGTFEKSFTGITLTGAPQSVELQ